MNVCSRESLDSRESRWGKFNVNEGLLSETT